MEHRRRDNLFATSLGQIVDFRFDEMVAGVFPDMIQRSVPGYSTVISMIATLADQYATANSYCYDLGCSVGAATLAMRSRIQQPGCRIIAVDNAPAMVKHCRQNIDNSGAGAQVDLVCADIQSIMISNASLVLLNYTLQFVPLADRAAIIESIYQGLNPGGVLLLSEKIAFSDPELSQLMTDLHHAFKRANGYSDLEISQKRTALEHVLIAETQACHLERLQQAGFSQCHVWFQCLNFMSFLAIK